MFYGLPRCIKEHPWSGEAHHLSHSFTHNRLIAVHGTLFARSFIFSERTMVQSCMGITQQLFALKAKAFILFFFPAIESDH